MVGLHFADESVEDNEHNSEHNFTLTLILIIDLDMAKK